MAKEVKQNSHAVRIIALIVGILINIIGNSLTIVSNEGAEPWTAAAVNANKVSALTGEGLSVGSFIILFGIIGTILNQVILSRKELPKLKDYQAWKKRISYPSSLKGKIKFKTKELGEDFNHCFIDKPRLMGELLYIFAFGYSVDFASWLFDRIHLNSLPKLPSIFLSLFGVTLFCVGISLYQRSNIIMHPNDDTSNLLRFVYLGGSAFQSQLVDIIPALLICGVCYPLLHGTIYSISWGTFYSIFFNGVIVMVADKFIWPSLTHNHKDKKGHHLFL